MVDGNILNNATKCSCLEVNRDFPGGSAGKESTCIVGDLGLISGWVGNIPWRRARLPIPVFWPGEFHGLYSPRGRKESDMTDFRCWRLIVGYIYGFTLIL